MITPNAIFFLHAFSTCAMAGLIWFVQIVHYPLLAHVSRAYFSSYSKLHAKKTTWVVGPLMLAELITSLVVYNQLSASIEKSLALSGLLMLLVIWLCTALTFIPIHNQLGRAYDKVLIEKLVKLNWLRTFLWSARALISLYLLLSWR